VVDTIVTELGVIHVRGVGLVLAELADGVTFADIQSVTEATLLASPGLREIRG